MLNVNLDTVPSFYKNYVINVKDLSLMQAFNTSNAIALSLVSSIPEDKGSFRYQPGKWSINELLCHMMDAERVFAYRALRFSRNDKTPLAGFDENEYAPEANAHSRSIAQIASEMKTLRQSTIDLYQGFSHEMLQRVGTASNVQLSVLTLGFIIAGHEAHHIKILKERYLVF